MASTTESLAVNPSWCDSTNYSYESVNSRYPLSKPIGKGSSDSTYAQWSLKTGFGSETYVFYLFDLSAIPEDATIDSVECTAKGYSSCSSNMINYVRTQTMQMFFGTSTAKGTAANLTNSVTTATIDGGTWTREELNDCRLRIYGIRSGSGTSDTFYHRFYGADLTVTYTYQSEKFMLKLSGAYNDVARTFKKVSGIWVEQTDLANVVDQTKRLVNGGEIVKPITVDITSSGHASYAYAEINGVKYYSNGGTTEVNAGDVITFGVYNGGKLKIDGETILTAGSGVTSTYDWTVPSGITRISIAPLYYTVISPTYYGDVTVTTS